MDADIHYGDFIALKGANGAGKSTLFNVLAGSVPLLKGQILHHKIDITALNELQRALWIGKLTQDPTQSCVIGLTVEQNLTLAGLKNKTAALRKLNYENNELAYFIAKSLGFDLEKHLRTRVGSLSGGQRQILVLIMVLLSTPDLLLLDEPTAALDEVTSQKLLLFIQKWVAEHKIAAIMITHDVQKAECFCNKSWFLEAGKLSAA